MARPRDVLNIPALGVRIEFVRTTEETRGELVEFDVAGRPQGIMTQSHVHPSQSERHEVIDGRMWIRTGALERLLGPGDVVETPAGMEHSHGTHERARVRVQVRPARQVEAWLERLASIQYLPGGWPKPVDGARLLLDFEGETHATTAPLRAQLVAARGVLKIAGAAAQSRR